MLWTIDNKKYIRDVKYTKLNKRKTILRFKNTTVKKLNFNVDCIVVSNIMR